MRYAHIGKRKQQAAGLPGEREDEEASLFCYMRRVHDIAGVARGGDRKEHIARTPIAINLLSKNHVRLHIVRKGCTQRGMLCQRNSRERTLKLLGINSKAPHSSAGRGVGGPSSARPQYGRHRWRFLRFRRLKVFHSFGTSSERFQKQKKWRIQAAEDRENVPSDLSGRFFHHSYRNSLAFSRYLTLHDFFCFFQPIGLSFKNKIGCHGNRAVEWGVSVEHGMTYCQWMMS